MWEWGGGRRLNDRMYDEEMKSLIRNIAMYGYKK